MDINKVFATGLPRNDAFSLKPVRLQERLKIDFKTIIVWYPTYRQNESRDIDLAGNTLPLIHDEKMADQLNEVAKNNNVLIIVKPHFAQDTALVKKLNLSNILLIDDSFFN